MVSVALVSLVFLRKSLHNLNLLSIRLVCHQRLQMLFLTVDSLVFEIQTLVSLHPGVSDASHSAETKTEEDAEKDDTDWEFRGYI